MNEAGRRVLVLYYDPGGRSLRPAVQRHLHTLDVSERGHDLVYYNTVRGAPAALARARPDAIILHTTLLCRRWSYDFSRLKWMLRWLADSDATKIAIPQDEYDHAEVLDEWLEEVGVDWIFSDFSADQRAVLYPRLHGRARFVECLTCYVDDAAADVAWQSRRPIADRSLRLVYRATRLPAWFGSHGRLKHEVAGRFEAAARAAGVPHDISTRPEDVLVGEAWQRFLGSGRAALGCESGSSVLDRRGEVQAAILALQGRLGTEPTTADLDQILQPGWDDHRFFAVGPRHFEAAQAGSAQVLVEGEYGGILRPEEHYVPVRRDLSDAEKAVERLEDTEMLEEMARRAHADIVTSGRYGDRAFARMLEDAMDERERPGRRGSLRWRSAAAAARLARNRRIGPGGISDPRPAATLAIVAAYGFLRCSAVRRTAWAWLRRPSAWIGGNSAALLSDALHAGLLSLIARGSPRVRMLNSSSPRIQWIDAAPDPEERGIGVAARCGSEGGVELQTMPPHGATTPRAMLPSAAAGQIRWTHRGSHAIAVCFSRHGGVRIPVDAHVFHTIEGGGARLLSDLGLDPVAEPAT